MSDLTPLDPDDVVAAARRADPGLAPETARLLAVEALGHLRDGATDAPDVARRLLAEHPEDGASAATVVARALFDSGTADSGTADSGTADSGTADSGGGGA